MRDGRPVCVLSAISRRWIGDQPGHPGNHITAIIGPSGCGKSTLLRALNRMNDLVPGARVEGQISARRRRTSTRRGVDVVDVRRRVGMVFQRPNPFPKSIYDNVAYGPRLYGVQPRRAGRDRRAQPAAARRCGTR